MTNSNATIVASRVFRTISLFIEQWPEATIHDLAKAMPQITAEAASDLYDNATIDRCAQMIIDHLGDHDLVPPWVGGQRRAPKTPLEAA